MSNANKNSKELEKLYEIYLQVQSGNKAAMDKLFEAKVIDDKPICKADEDNKKERMQNLDNVLDVEFVIENEREKEKNKQENKWLDSSDSMVTFAFPILKKMLYNKKRRFLTNEKNIDHENGNHSKFYSGEYEITDIDSVMYDTILEIFTKKTDDNNYLTIDDKKNEGEPIRDGVSLMKNISYFVSIRINKRQESIRLDIPIMSYFDEESQEEVSLILDKCAFDDYLENGDEVMLERCLRLILQKQSSLVYRHMML